MKKPNLTIPKPFPRILQFEKMAYGLFLHWGLYSQLGRGEWVMLLEKIPARKYNQLEKTFTAADFDARAWARLAKAAGMRYITLTTRHHEGFSLYDTRGLNKFDAPHSPAGRDLVAEFVEACRAEGIVPFFYHTTLDWQWFPDPGLVPDGGPKFPEYLDYLHASVEVLCRNYGKIGGLWFDGNWAHPKAEWKEDRLYAMIRRYQPEAMIINNTGLGAEGVLGHPEIDSTTFEQGLPKRPDRRGWKKYVAGEMCQTMNTHWGVGWRDFRYLSPHQVIENLCLSRKAGANYLLNIGPTPQGGIPDYEGATVRRTGQWLELFRKAIEARPVDGLFCTGRDFMLKEGSTYYYFAFDLSNKGNEHVTLSQGLLGLRPVKGLQEKIRSARWLDNQEQLAWTQNLPEKLFALEATAYPYGSNFVVRVAELKT